MNIYIFALIVYNGKSIVVFLYDLDIDIDSREEKKIGIKVFIMWVTLSLLVACLYFLCNAIHYGLQNSILLNCIYFLENIILAINYICLHSMMAYFCYAMQQKLADLQRKFTNLKQLPNLFRQLLVIQNYVKIFDQFYNNYLFFMIMLLFFTCVSNLTILYFDRFKTMPWSIVCIFETLSNIFLFCYLSNKINKSYIGIINKYEQLQLLMDDTQLIQFKHSLVSRLYSLRDDMCFTAFNLYPINMKTFLSILSMIVTFSVIIIQTHD